MIGVVSSVVVLALAVGLLLLVGPADDVELPERVDGLVAADLEAAYPDADVPPERIEQQAAAYAVNADGYCDVFDGADADARTYLDPDSPDTLFGVVAVAADAGPLVPQDGFVDAERAGLRAAARRADHRRRRRVPADAQPAAARRRPTTSPTRPLPDAHWCQRRSGTLTVRVRSSASDTGAVVDVVDDALGRAGLRPRPWTSPSARCACWSRSRSSSWSSSRS